MTIQNLDPADIARWLGERSILLIDVREPAEFAEERIQGALLFPLSTFEPKALPDSEGRRIVFHCGSGVRSARAVAACESAGIAIDSHMKGGIKAWKASGLPTLRIDPDTGKMKETR